jgi:hypothetical protein
VLGTGAIVTELPPLAWVYHLNVFPSSPFAVSAEAVVPTQYATVDATAGAAKL